MIQILKPFLSAIDRLIEALFHPDTEKKHPWLSWIWFVGLYLVGVILWGIFLNWGSIPFDYQDWAEVTAPRLAFLHDAVIKGALPLHMPDSSALRGLTDRYLAIPDLLLSPQVILMRFLQVGPFILVNTLLLYTLGVLALLWLRRRFALSLFTYSVLFFLFNFNGHILGHLSIGHANWAGYFLFPWLVVQTFRLLDGRKDLQFDRSRHAFWGWAAQTALLLFALFLQGAFHQYVWWLIFFGLLALVSWKNFWAIFKALVFAVLISMVRIGPAMLVAGQYDTQFLGGYPSLAHLLWAMLIPRGPWEALAGTLGFPFNTLSWWEFDLFLGLIGTATVLYFGVFRWMKNRNNGSLYPELLLPLLAMATLSIGQVYRIFMVVPLLAGERVSSRLFSLPLAFLIILAAIEMQRWLEQAHLGTATRLAGWMGLGLMVNDLLLELRLWRVTNAAVNFPVTAVDLSIKVVANHPDPPYTTALGIGTVVSLVSIAVLLFLAWREVRKRI